MIVLFLYIAICVASLLFLNDWLSKPRGSPPGPFAWPLIGTLPTPGKTLLHYLQDCRRKYGDVFRLQLGSCYTVCVCEYEAIKETLNNNSIQGRPHLYFALNPYQGKGIVSSSGIVWRDSRRFAIRHLKDAGMGREMRMEHVISYEANILVEDFSKYTGIPTEIPWSLNAAVFNVIWKLVADKRYEIDTKYVNVLHTLLSDMMHMGNQEGFFLNMWPLVAKYLPLYIKKKFFKEDRKNMYNEQIVEIMQDVIDEHKKYLDEENPRDLIDNYLLEINKTKDDDSARVTEEDLCALLIDLFIAGSETSSTTVRWYILFMAKYPQIQAKVQDQIDTVVGKDRLLTFEDKERLPYFEATILETLRIKLIAPLAAAHLAEEDTYIKGYYIQKGSAVNPHLEACHLEDKFWEKPEEFYPENFINDDGTVNSKKEGFIPFGFGKRVCIGDNLAKMELYMFLGALMQNFNFCAVSGEELNTQSNLNERLFHMPRPFKIIISKRD